MKKVKKVLGGIFFVLFFACLGVIGGYYGSLNGLTLTGFILLIFFVMITFVLHIIIHEIGHGIFGVMTGYEFISIRLFSLMLTTSPERGFALKRHRVPGTLGQCLLEPPTYVESVFPYQLYLLGGVLMNGLVSLGVLLALGYHSLLGNIFVVIGILVILTNAWPLGFNDGATLSLARKNETNQYLLYLQLKVHSLLNGGQTYVELPLEYFQPVTELSKDNYLTQFQVMMTVSRYVEERKWEALGQEIDHLWNDKDVFILPYLIELKKEAIFYWCYQSPSDERMEDTWCDAVIQKNLSIPQSNHFRIKAMYQWRIEKNLVSALHCLQEGMTYMEQLPTEGDKQVELGLNRWMETKIKKELEGK